MIVSRYTSRSTIILSKKILGPLAAFAQSRHLRPGKVLARHRNYRIPPNISP
jgi:hypothetical protein